MIVYNQYNKSIWTSWCIFIYRRNTSFDLGTSRIFEWTLTSLMLDMWITWISTNPFTSEFYSSDKKTKQLTDCCMKTSWHRMVKIKPYKQTSVSQAYFLAQWFSLFNITLMVCGTEALLLPTKANKNWQNLLTWDQHTYYLLRSQVERLTTNGDSQILDILKKSTSSKDPIIMVCQVWPFTKLAYTSSSSSKPLVPNKLD